MFICQWYIFTWVSWRRINLLSKLYKNYLPYPSRIDVCCWLKMNHIGKVDAYCHQANIIQYPLNIEKMKSNFGHIFQWKHICNYCMHFGYYLSGHCFLYLGSIVFTAKTLAIKFALIRSWGDFRLKTWNPNFV